MRYLAATSTSPRPYRQLLRNGRPAYPKPMPVLSSIAASTCVPVRLSGENVKAESKPVTPSESRVRWMRATVLSTALPAAELSSGTKGAMAKARSACRVAPHWPALLRVAHDGLSAQCASAVSNWARNTALAGTPLRSRGLRPRLPPWLDSWSELRVATRTIGTSRLTDNRFVRPSSALTGYER